MLKKLLFIIAGVAALVNVALAAQDINTADRAALESIKDIGPKTADAIVKERDKGGKFKDWNDLITRVKGVGDKNAAKMSADGLTVNGQALANAPAAGKKEKSSPAAAAKETTAPAADTAKAAKPAAADAAKDTKATTAPAATDKMTKKSEKKEPVKN
jgi:competence protein ComEA